MFEIRATPKFVNMLNRKMMNMMRMTMRTSFILVSVVAHHLEVHLLRLSWWCLGHLLPMLMLLRGLPATQVLLLGMKFLQFITSRSLCPKLLVLLFLWGLHPQLFW